jgi:NADPH:quinone reductase-like Zn-dependent oxidoreductase
MKAIVSRDYGPPDEVLEPEDIEVPVPGDDDVVVRVHATSANPADWHLVRGEPYLARVQLGLRRPKNQVLGCDVAGRVHAVGRDASSFQVGDAVYGSPIMRGFGAFAEYVRVPVDLLARKPVNLSFEQAAAVPVAALTALQALRDHGRLQAGQRVLLIGASGGIGTFAIQIAKAFDAEVTAVCSTRNLELVRSLGADHVIDYTTDDPTRGERRYDLVLQIVGTATPSHCRRVLGPQGTLVQISGDASGRWIGPFGRMVRGRLLSPFVSQRITSFVMTPNGEDLQQLTDLVESGRVTPVIDRTYSLTEVPFAVRYVEEGHARGKVVVTVAPDDQPDHDDP